MPVDTNHGLEASITTGTKKSRDRQSRGTSTGDVAPDVNTPESNSGDKAPSGAEIAPQAGACGKAVPLNDMALLTSASHADPFSFLGRHTDENGEVFRCYLPRMANVWIENQAEPLYRFPHSDLFEYRGDFTNIPKHPELRCERDEGQVITVHDPYSFHSVLSPEDLSRFHAGTHVEAQTVLGAHLIEIDGVQGSLFVVWAPNAGRVSVVGGFNEWDGRCHPMRLHPTTGIWELFVPGLHEGPYKFEIRNASSGEVATKSDPFARATECRPATASLITRPSDYSWEDQSWQQKQATTRWLDQPVSIYEVHLGSWRRDDDGQFLNYRTLAPAVCKQARTLGFTHVELLPVTEHPLDESWGYQVTGYYAPTSRHGSPNDFRWFVDYCHNQGLGVILDWVPAHFPRDEHAMARFDGEALFEYHDPWRAEQRDWGTLVFNFERNEVRSFLISSALYWLKEFHVDCLRVDAVASMLYLNFSRQSEQWVPNRFGGHHNLEAIEFIRELNQTVHSLCPGSLMIAEESSDWHGVTLEVEAGGLGFDLKWNMGWMHDTLNYLSKEPVHRRHHQDWLTFGPVYAFDENFLLPLSHDEVVHLKKSLFGRMPGDEWQKFANLRLLYTYQWVYPGKQLLFMGGEFAQPGEWDAASSLPWNRATEPLAQGIGQLLRELNAVQQSTPALYEHDCKEGGFEWLDGDDREKSVISFLRHGRDSSVVVILNFTPEPWQAYRLSISEAGTYQVLFNSDSAQFGGTGLTIESRYQTDAKGHGGRSDSLVVQLPPLAGLILKKC